MKLSIVNTAMLLSKDLVLIQFIKSHFTYEVLILVKERFAFLMIIKRLKTISTSTNGIDREIFFFPLTSFVTEKGRNKKIKKYQRDQLFKIFIMHGNNIEKSATLYSYGSKYI